MVITKFFLMLIMMLNISLTADNPQQQIDDALANLTPAEFLDLNYDLEQQSAYPQDPRKILSILTISGTPIDSSLYEELYTRDFPTSAKIQDLFFYDWTSRELYYAGLLGQTEAGSLGEAARISVISTAYARYISPLWCNVGYCSTTLYQEMVRPGQFLGPEYATEIGFNFVNKYSLLAAYKFALGWQNWYNESDGCFGYEYFNSYPGGPRDCYMEVPNWNNTGVIWTEFFSTPSFVQEVQSESFRNLNQSR